MNKPLREGFVDDAAAQPVALDEPQAPEVPGPEIVQESWPIRIRLIYKPIRNNAGEDIRELVFREPNGGDINRNGNPVRIDQHGDPIIDERKMTLIMSALTGVLTPLLERMDPRDWNSCAYRLRNFFLPDFRGW